MLDRILTAQTLSASMQVVAEDDEHNPDILDQNLTAQTLSARMQDFGEDKTLTCLIKTLQHRLSAKMQDFGEDGQQNPDMLHQNLTAQTFSQDTRLLRRR